MTRFSLGLLFVFLFPMAIWAQTRERDLSRENWMLKTGNDLHFKFYPAKVPGTVHTDLLANKIISDPFFGENEKQLQWIEKNDWLYTMDFNVSKAELANENCILQFDGLDTYAEVSLNGTKIITADNMFRIWKADVKKLLKVGKNMLHVQFHSASEKGKELAKKLPYTLPGDEKIFTRKAQYHYGWDWGPRFVTTGIWKKVTLRFWNKALITHLKCNQLSAEKGEIQFVAEIQSTIQGKFQLKINDKAKVIDLKKGKNRIVSAYTIENPKLWWPNDLGEAHLYPFEITLAHKLNSLSSQKLNVGLRTIELIQEKDTIGTSFYFKVNGIPVFMKGANYIPPDSFLPRITDSVYKNTVKNAVAANMNMLRVWGGGVYPDDTFYDECDKNGILVWQDFMFACAMYPGDKAFLENVKSEIIDNVSRLQNHPSIALWCGNNEIDEGWHNWGWQKQYGYSKEQEAAIWNDYKALFHELIPQTLSNLLAPNENRYWPSSPSIGWGKKESLLSGDSHYWGVWWGMEPFEVYEKKVGRFMSEYGFQGMPNLETFKSFANNEDMNLDSDAVKNHQKHASGYQTINEYMARDYKVPAKFEDYIYVSQLLQADGMKTAIEAHRRAKPNCMGTLFWQLNDCWPVTSWSSVDYYGRWKALQYQVKRSFEPILVSISENEVNYEITLVSDEPNPYNVTLEIELLDFFGKQLEKDEVVFERQGNSSIVLAALPKENYKGKKMNELLFSVTATFQGGKTVNRLYYFVKPKELQLPKPNIKITKIDELTYEVSSDVLAKNVFLYSETETFFSDNYFDILPNQTVRITLSKAIENIQAKSLFDTLK